MGTYLTRVNDLGTPLFRSHDIYPQEAQPFLRFLNNLVQARSDEFFQRLVAYACSREDDLFVDLIPSLPAPYVGSTPRRLPLITTDRGPEPLDRSTMRNIIYAAKELLDDRYPNLLPFTERLTELSHEEPPTVRVRDHLPAYLPDVLLNMLQDTVTRYDEAEGLF